MYLSRITLTPSRVAFGWLANPYRVHQRLLMACGDDPRVLFRIESDEQTAQILVQTCCSPAWEKAFAEFRILAKPVEWKVVDLNLAVGQRYRFRLLANPSVKRAGKRLGLLKEAEQRTWLERKLADSGAELLGCWVHPEGMQKAQKGAAKDVAPQTHYAVLYDGALRATDPDRLRQAVESGIGPAKGYGFGLLSLGGM